MPTLTLEGVPEALLARLARAAAGNGRCLNSEVIVLLTRWAEGPSARAERRWIGWGGPAAADPTAPDTSQAGAGRGPGHGAPVPEASRRV